MKTESENRESPLPPLIRVGKKIMITLILNLFYTIIN